MTQAKILETFTAEYVDVPPPSDAFRFTLFKEVEGEWISTGYVSDCSVETPECEFEIVESGKYKVRCQRLNVFDQMMGPIAESDPTYVGTAGQYQAPLKIAFGVATGEPEIPAMPLKFDDDRPF